MSKHQLRDRLLKDLAASGYPPLRSLSPSAMKALAERWFSAFAPNVRKAKNVDVYLGYRWHGFSYEMEPHIAGSDALAKYLKKRGPFIVFDEDGGFALLCDQNSGVPPDLTSLGDDLYVCDPDCTWTMAFTHEQPEVGPYFSGDATAITPMNTFSRLIFNRPSNCLILHEGFIGPDLNPLETLHFREISSGVSEIRQIVLPGENVRLRSPVANARHPVIFLNEWLSVGIGLDWHAVSAIHLPDGTRTKLVDSSSIKLPSSCTRAWVSEIFSAEDDGKTLVCRLVFESPTRPGCSEVKYFLGELDVENGESRILADLPNVYF